MRRSSLSPGLSLAFAATLAATAASAQDATSPSTPSPAVATFHNVSIEWPIGGDDDADGVVAVRFRAVGDPGYRAAMPLFRVPAGSNQAFSWGNRHAGSVFGLQPGTSYEIELTLTDPDGGAATEILEVTTRTWPEAAGLPETPVDPGSLASALAAATPGQVLLLGDGSYGPITVQVDGAPGQPIVLRAANPGGAVVEGDVRVDGRSHVFVEGLVVHGKVKFNDAQFLVIRGNRIETTEDGVVAFGTGTRGTLVVDNEIFGATAWAESSLGVDGDNIGEGVVLTGSENVIAWNRVVGFRDCISLLEDDLAIDQTSIDIFGNDLSVCADDGIEADFSMGNVRVYGNRIADSFMGISSQPSLGGPTYFVRNVMYDVLYSPFKLQRGSVGDVGIHNTIVKSGDAFAVYTEDVWSRAWFRNNLFLGGPGQDHNGYDSGPGDVAVLRTADASCSFDYDGFGAIGVGAFRGRIGDAAFGSLAEMRASTTEAHAIEVDLSIFAEAVAYPADPYADLDVPSLGLAEGSAPVDAGLALANVNDGFAGAAPDLGAHELGQPLPEYGPGGTLPGSGAGGGSSSSTGGTGGGGSSGEPSGGGAGGSGQGAGDSAVAGGNGDASVGAGSPLGAGGGDAAAGDDGCGCRVVGASLRRRDDGAPRWASVGLAALALSVAVARRRRDR